MRLKPVGVFVAAVIGLATPIQIHFKLDGKGPVCRASFNNAGAEIGCYCTPEPLGADCTAPNYIYVCNGQRATPPSSSVHVEDVAWRLADPIN